MASFEEICERVRQKRFEQGRDQVADDQWKAEFDEDQRRYDQAWEQEYGSGDSGDSDGSGGGSGGSGGGSDGSGGGSDGSGGTDRSGATDAASEDAYRNRDNGGRGLSPDGQAFLDSLPYPHAGSDTSRWKAVVLERLMNSGLSAKDKELIAYQLGL